MTPVVVLASGRGSNFEAILRAIQRGSLSARVLALLSDQPNALALEKARQAGMKAVVVPYPTSSEQAVANSAQLTKRDKHGELILDECKKLAQASGEFPRFLILAGYMRVVSSRVIEAFRSERGYSRIVNIHPSLLPAFPGTDSYGQAYKYGCKVAGVSVHLVEEKVDAGPICAQEAFSIEDCRSVEEVEARGLRIEHRLFSETLSWVLTENFNVDNMQSPERRLCVRKN